MFENYHLLHFLTHYLNTPVFSSPTQTQFSTHISSSISNSCSLAATVVFSTAVAIPWRLKIDREQIHYYVGGYYLNYECL
jgi:hypothetical protein